MTFARRVDANHMAITHALRQCGWHVEDTSRVGRGFPDLVALKDGRVEFLEVKDGSKAPSARKLTRAEARVCDAFASKRVQVRVIESVEEAVRL